MATYTAKYLVTDALSVRGGPYQNTTINIAGHDWVETGYSTALDANDNIVINKYELQGLVDVSTLGNQRIEGASWDSVGTTFYSLYDQTIDNTDEIPPQYLIGSTDSLSAGWSGSSNSATSGDFLWTSSSTATYNSTTPLSLPGVHDLVASGVDDAAQYVLGKAAEGLGVTPLWDAINRVSTVKSALTNFANGGSDTLNQLLNGFNNGMTAQQADALLKSFMDTTAFDFHQAAEEVLGTGAGDALETAMDGLRFAEQWAVNPNTGAIIHSRVDVEEGASTGYFGQHAQFTGDPSYRNDVVLSGDTSDNIDTGYDTGFTPKAQIDFVAAGGGADVIQSYEGADVISAGSGNDKIIAGPGNDYIDGGRGLDTAYYTGASSDYSIAHNPDASITVTDNRPGSPDGTDTLISVEHLIFTNGAANPLYAPLQAISIATPSPILQDFNGDGYSDILWQNTNGQAASWELSGTTPIDQQGIGFNPGPDWKAVGTGDFNGDGFSDILWQNTNGQVAIWEMSGNIPIRQDPVSFNPGPSWKAVGTGDFNGDGLSDILWQNANGQVAIWEMNGTTPVHQDPVSFNPGPSWRAIGAGDFNGDGDSDILWQNANGQVAIWEMSGASPILQDPVSFNPGADWRAVGTGDFNDDGKSDILWQNTNGQVAIWEMNGANPIHQDLVSFNPGADWKAIGTGDFNSDGHSDILFQNTASGQAAIWEMSGTTPITQSAINSLPGPGWQAIKA